MDLPLILILALGLVVALAVIGSRKGAGRDAKPPRSFPYETRGTLFSPAERSFFGVLEQAVGERYRIFGKVRLADVIKARTQDKSEWRRAFNAISAKHVDFVLCDPKDTRIVAVVELDDRSHEKGERRARDDFLERALAASGVKLLRFPAKAGYSLEEMRQRLNGLGGGGRE